MTRPLHKKNGAQRPISPCSAIDADVLVFCFQTGLLFSRQVEAGARGALWNIFSGTFPQVRPAKPQAGKESSTAKPLRSHRLLGRRGQLGKGIGFLHSQIGKDLTIEIDSRLLQAMNQVAVRNAVQLGSGADSHNPQTAKVALANATVTHGVLQRLLNGFLCGPMQFALGASESRSQL